MHHMMCKKASPHGALHSYTHYFVHEFGPGTLQVFIASIQLLEHQSSPSAIAFAKQ